ncbi:hypothetical protein BDW74DRAFT_172595 [Aspergillus multicolor]|uniref:uncharacterized protein n=1 Tax=Aspergillus multicolor TaxID=41759 RepID=UPI003CCD5200
MQPRKMSAPMINKPPWYQGQQAPPQQVYSGTDGRLIPNPMLRSMDPSSGKQNEAASSGNASAEAKPGVNDEDVGVRRDSYDMTGAGAGTGWGDEDGFYGFL